MALFGELVIDLGYVTEEQYEQVIEMQKKGRAKLGQIMKHLRLIREDQVAEILDKQKESDGNLFGNCAVELRFVDEKQRNEAVRYQTNSKGVLGDMLIQLGYLTRDQRDDVIKQQLLN